MELSRRFCTSDQGDWDDSRDHTVLHDKANRIVDDYLKLARALALTLDPANRTGTRLGQWLTMANDGHYMEDWGDLFVGTGQSDMLKAKLLVDNIRPVQKGKFLLLGSSGVGKASFARYVAHCAVEEGNVVVWISGKIIVAQKVVKSGQKSSGPSAIPQ